MLSKWIVNEGEFKGLEVVVLRPEGDKCLCFDKKGIFYWFNKSNLSIRIPIIDESSG